MGTFFEQFIYSTHKICQINSNMRIIVIINLLIWILSIVLIITGKIIQCYYPNWSSLGSGDAKFLPERIDPFLCSHLTYVYAELDDQNYIIKPQNFAVDLEYNGGLGLYGRITSLKHRNPNLRVLLGIGGFLDSHQTRGFKRISKYSKLISNRSLWKHFIDHAIHFLIRFRFDGLEIHWEFPTIADRSNLTEFLKECKMQFDYHKLMLTLNVATNPSLIDAYDIGALNRFVDFVHLMTYDFHGFYEGFTNYISPIRAEGEDYSVDKAVQMYIKRGLDRQKIVIGIATYAKSYKLLKSNVTDVGSPVAGPGSEGPCTKTKGYLAYYEVCGKEWNRISDISGISGAYVFKDEQWAAYNDLKSIKTKMRYVLNEQLLGVSFWSLDQDDFNAFCGNGVFPIINTAKKELEQMTRSPEKNPLSQYVDRCMTDGFYQDQLDCRKFYHCFHGVVENRGCGQPLYWNQTCQCCIVTKDHCMEGTRVW